jgi:hypothetical protein
MAVQIGDTFLFGEGSHLWIVISDPAQNHGDFVIVNLTKNEFRAGKDCELNVGEHQWIKEKCYVSFGDARKVTPIEAARIQALISQDQIKQHFPMRANIIHKIVQAGLKSKALTPELKALL